MCRPSPVLPRLAAGREERVEDLADVLRRDALAVVGEDDAHRILRAAR